MTTESSASPEKPPTTKVVEFHYAQFGEESVQLSPAFHKELVARAAKRLAEQEES